MATATTTVGLSSIALPVRRTTSSSSSRSGSFLARGAVARNSRILPLKAAPSRLPCSSSSFGFLSSTITENRLRRIRGDVVGASKGGGALGAVCAIPASPENLRWVLVAASAALMFVKSAGLQTQFLVPLLAVEAPRKALGWLQGDYGLWIAFASLAVKVFNFLPPQLELPLYVILLIITAPIQITQYRGTQAAAGVSLAIAAYLGYQHYQKSESLKGAFQGESVFQSIAIIVLIVIPLLFLINGSSV